MGVEMREETSRNNCYLPSIHRIAINYVSHYRPPHSMAQLRRKSLSVSSIDHSSRRVVF